jgi:hypothetical protein
VGAAVAAAALGVAPFACSAPPALLGSGGQCFQTTDCQQGLACVQQKSGPSICSTDFSPIVSTEEAGGADAPAKAQEAGEGAAEGEGGGSEAMVPSPDSASAPDVGAPQQDAKPPPMEAAPEAAVSPPDATPDTSSVGADSGVGD